LTSGGFRIISETLVNLTPHEVQTAALRDGDVRLFVRPFLCLLAFPVAAARIWNTLPVNVVSASTVQSFRHKLKSFLFDQSFPN